MTDITCNAIIEETKIIISELDSTPIEIDISGDVDFTAVVTLLAKKIEDWNRIELTVPDDESIDDEKHKLIVNTLKDIFNNYNEVLLEEDNDDDWQMTDWWADSACFFWTSLQ